MGEVVNLNRARKARARVADKVQAEENRALHGLTKGERAEIAAEKALLNHRLNGARREDDPAGP